MFDKRLIVSKAATTYHHVTHCSIEREPFSRRLEDVKFKIRNNRMKEGKKDNNNKIFIS